MGTATNFSVGDRLWFDHDKQPYRIRACNDRFLICTKPFNLRRTVFYTIVDLQKDIRGTENLVFCMGFETDEDCREALQRLHAGKSEVSYRNRVELHISRHDKALILNKPLMITQKQIDAATAEHVRTVMSSDDVLHNPDAVKAVGGDFVAGIRWAMQQHDSGTNDSTLTSFGDAVAALKQGKHVSRSGWNGKNMFLLLVYPYHNSQFAVIEKPDLVGTLLPWIGMKTADNGFVPWLASQTDILADDWCILN